MFAQFTAMIYTNIWSFIYRPVCCYTRY